MATLSRRDRALAQLATPATVAGCLVEVLLCQRDLGEAVEDGADAVVAGTSGALEQGQRLLEERARRVEVAVGELDLAEARASARLEEVVASQAPDRRIRIAGPHACLRGAPVVLVGEQDPRGRRRRVVARVDGGARGLVHRGLELGGRATELPQHVGAQHEELRLERPVAGGPHPCDCGLDERERFLLLAGRVERGRARERALRVVDDGALRGIGGGRVDRGQRAHVRAVVDGRELRDGGSGVVHHDAVGLGEHVHQRARLPPLDVQAAGAEVEHGLGLLSAEARRGAALRAHRDPALAHPVERRVDHAERALRVRRIRGAEGREDHPAPRLVPDAGERGRVGHAEGRALRRVTRARDAHGERGDGDQRHADAAGRDERPARDRVEERAHRLPAVLGSLREPAREHATEPPRRPSRRGPSLRGRAPVTASWTVTQ